MIIFLGILAALHVHAYLVCVCAVALGEWLCVCAQELIRRKIQKLERLVQCKEFVSHMETFTSRLQVF